MVGSIRRVQLPLARVQRAAFDSCGCTDWATLFETRRESVCRVPAFTYHRGSARSRPAVAIGMVARRPVVAGGFLPLGMQNPRPMEWRKLARLLPGTLIAGGWRGGVREVHGIS